MASTAGLVPITREFLRKFYEGYPYDDPSQDFHELQKELDGSISKLVDQLPQGIEVFISGTCQEESRCNLCFADQGEYVYGAAS
jgi:hypothetical protein